MCLSVLDIKALCWYHPAACAPPTCRQKPDPSCHLPALWCCIFVTMLLCNAPHSPCHSCPHCTSALCIPTLCARTYETSKIARAQPRVMFENLTRTVRISFLGYRNFARDRDKQCRTQSEVL